MALLVQKYGGTSLGSLARIQAVAERVLAMHRQGHRLALVCSAMQGETDRLIDLAKSLMPVPDPLAYDMMVSTGEQVSVSLLAMALKICGLEALPMTGVQAGIKTDSCHQKARILNVKDDFLNKQLSDGVIPVVAGFQGVDASGSITTFGRGGSDTTAVALAAALGADECQIYTDVSGVYTADPRVVRNARRLDHLSIEAMLELSGLGAKVLQIRAVEYAGRCKVPIRVLSSFESGPGTLITEGDGILEQPLVSGIAFERGQARVILMGMPNRADQAAWVLGALSQRGIEVGMMVQNTTVDAVRMDFAFTVQRGTLESILLILNEIKDKLAFQKLHSDTRVATLSVVGVGIRSHPAVATKVFGALAEEGISVQMVSTSEIKMSVVVDEKYLELGVRALHDAFGLESAKTPSKEFIFCS